jgi:hypothetical protein
VSLKEGKRKMGESLYALVVRDGKTFVETCNNVG